MNVKELKELLKDYDDCVEVRFDMDSADYYDHATSEDPVIQGGQFVEDGFTETGIPSKSYQRNAEFCYLLLKA